MKSSLDRPTTVDLFAGCGGFSLGLKKAGFKVIAANELNLSASKTYEFNFPETKMFTSDIKDLNFIQIKELIGDKPLDLLTAGPPCQGFSMAGKRNHDDPRNQLFLHIVRAINELKPRVFVMENVKGLMSIDGGRAFSNIINEFKATDYHVNFKVLNASDFGVPQTRERVFIVGSKNPIPPEELFPKRKRIQVTIREAISDLAFLGINDRGLKYRIPPRSSYQKMMRRKSKELFNHETPNHSRKIQERFSSVPIGKNGSDALKKVGTNKHTYYKLNPKKPSRTMTTLPEDFIHYSKNRIPTVREMARLQSFPDDFVFLGPRTTGGARRKVEVPQYTQVGNAVPPLLAEAIGKALKKVIIKYYWSEKWLTLSQVTNEVK